MPTIHERESFNDYSGFEREVLLRLQTIEREFLIRLENIEENQATLKGELKSGQETIWKEIKEERVQNLQQFSQHGLELSNVREQLARIQGAIALGKVVWVFVVGIIGSILAYLFRKG